MVTHGSKRIHDGHEQFFHRQYGWLAAQDFFDTMAEQADADALDLTPDCLERQGGESVAHFRQRMRELDDWRDD